MAVAACTSPAALAPMVRMNVPRLVVATEILDEVEPGRVTEAGDTLHVETPVQLSVTVLEKPLIGCSVTV